MNFNFGLLPKVETRSRKTKRASRFENCLKAWRASALSRNGPWRLCIRLDAGYSPVSGGSYPEGTEAAPNIPTRSHRPESAGGKTFLILSIKHLYNCFEAGFLPGPSRFRAPRDKQQRKQDYDVR